MAVVAAELDPWPSPTALSAALSQAGIAYRLGKFDLRLTAFEHFVFRDIRQISGSGSLTADGAHVADLTKAARTVSAALMQANIRHRFEIYDASAGDLVGYLHHDWPSEVSIPED